MYYCQDIVHSFSTLSITITFLLDPEIRLIFPDERVFNAWRTGLDELLVILFSPPDAELELRVPSSTNVENTKVSIEDGKIRGLGFSCRQEADLNARHISYNLKYQETNSAMHPKTPSKEQLRKRQKMAEYLFKGVERKGRSPMERLLGWSGISPKPQTKRSTDNTGELSLRSIGTQTEEEFLQASVWNSRLNSDKKASKPQHHPADSPSAGVIERSSFPDANDGRRSATSPGTSFQHEHHAQQPLYSPASTSGTPNVLFVDINKEAGELSSLSPKTPSSRWLQSLSFSIDVIDFGSLKVGKLLGSGSEGDVYAAWFQETPVAIKRFNNLDDAAYEVGMYLSIGLHDNIVSLRALCQHESNMYLIMEFCPRCVRTCHHVEVSIETKDLF